MSPFGYGLVGKPPRRPSLRVPAFLQTDRQIGGGHIAYGCIPPRVRLHPAAPKHDAARQTAVAETVIPRGVPCPSVGFAQTCVAAQTRSYPTSGIVRPSTTEQHPFCLLLGVQWLGYPLPAPTPAASPKTRRHRRA